MNIVAWIWLAVLSAAVIWILARLDKLLTVVCYMGKKYFVEEEDNKIDVEGFIKEMKEKVKNGGIKSEEDMQAVANELAEKYGVDHVEVMKIASIKMDDKKKTTKNKTIKNKSNIKGVY